MANPPVTPDPTPPAGGDDEGDRNARLLAMVGLKPDGSQGEEPAPTPDAQPQAAAEEPSTLASWAKKDHRITKEKLAAAGAEFKSALAQAPSDLADIAKATVRGAGRGIGEVGKDVIEGLDVIGSKTKQGKAFLAKNGKSASQDFNEQVNKVEAQVLPAAPTTAAGNIAQSISQFAVGMIGVGKATGGIRLTTKLAGLAKTALQGGAAQAIAFDPLEARMSNMVESLTENHPGIAHEVATYLAAKPTDTRADGRIKNFLEGMMMTAAADSLIAGLRGVKTIREARATGGEEAAQKAAQEVSDELAAKVLPKEGAPVSENPPVAATQEVVVAPTEKPLPREHFEKIAETESQDWSIPTDEASTPDSAVNAAAHISLWKKHGDPGEVTAWKHTFAWHVNELGLTPQQFWEKHAEDIARKTYEVGAEYGAHVRNTPSLNGLRAAMAEGKSEYEIDEILRNELGIDTSVKAPKVSEADAAANQELGLPGTGATIEPRLAETPAELNPKVLAQDDADSIIKEITGQEDFPVDRMTGLINHNYVNGPGTMRQVLELTAEKIAPKIKAGEVQTWKQADELSEAFGSSPEELWANLKVASADAEKQTGMLLAARKQMQGIAKQIWDEGRLIDSGKVTDRTKINSMVEGLAEMESILFPIRRSHARATRSWGFSTDPKISAQQLKGIIASGGDITAMSKILRPPSWAQKTLSAYTEYWVNAILSGPKTHLVNITSNTIQMGLRPLEKMAGGKFTEGFDQYVGVVKAANDARKMAWKALLNEESILDPKALKGEGMQRHAITAENFGMSNNSAMGQVTNWLGKAVRLPTRMLLSADEFFKQLNYRGNVYSMATREGMQRGMKGDTLANYIESRVADSFDKTGAGIDQAALHEARLATFTEDLNPGLIRNTSNFVAQHPWMRLITPFIRTPSNIVKELTWHTPGVNMFLKSYRTELFAGGQRAAAARGMWLTGGTLWTGAISLALEDRITGRGPSDPTEKAIKMQSGWRPYSVKIGDQYIDYSRFDPYASALGLAADFAEVHGQMKGKDAEDIAVAMGAAMARNLTSKTYLRGISEFLEAIDQSHKESPQRFKYWIESRVASHIPSAAKQLGGLVDNDDTMRETRSILDAVKARIPGFSSTLPPKRNFLGEPVHYPAGFGPDSISPIAYSTELHDDVKDELARLSYAFKNPSEKVGNKGRIDLTKYKNAQGQDAYDRLMELHSIERRGRYTLKEKLSNTIQSDAYKKLSEGGPDDYTSGKLKRIQTIRGEYLEACMHRLRKEYPNLNTDMKADEDNARKALYKGPDGLQSLIGQ